MRVVFQNLLIALVLMASCTVILLHLTSNQSSAAGDNHYHVGNARNVDRHDDSNNNIIDKNNKNNNNGERQCSSAPCFTCANVSLLAPLMAHAVELGAGFYKRAVGVQFDRTALVVKLPHARAAPYLAERWAAKNGGEQLAAQVVREKLANKFADERAQMLRWAPLAPTNVPRVYGGCHDATRSADDALAIVTIVEPLRALGDVTFDNDVSMSQRLAIARSLLRLVDLWSALPAFNHSRADSDAISNVKDYVVRDATAVIYGDFDPKQVSRIRFDMLICLMLRSVWC